MAKADLRWYWKPTRGACIAVAKVVRATEQTGAAEKAWLNVKPSAARFSILGVTPSLWPYSLR